MQLNGEQRELFHKSLLSAFPDLSKLRQMVDFKLDENLDAIAMGENHSDIVFKLIKWAESEGKVNDLLTAARESNPGNSELLSFQEQMQSQFDENSQSEINIYSSKAKHLYHCKFRAECEHDVNELIKILNPHVKEITKIKKASFPDIDVEMSAYLPLDEIQAAIKDIEDGHVMLETVELKHDYTGERKYLFESTHYLKIEEDNLTSEREVDYTHLQDLLKAGKWKEADKETLKVMLKVADREKQGWLDSDSIQKFPCTDLYTIDQLWVKYSDGHFGFSVQKRIWGRVGKDIYKLGYRVGWRRSRILKEEGMLWWKKEEREVMEWRAYSSFDFSLSAQKGHLPVMSLSGYCGYLLLGSHIFSRVQTCKM